MATSNITRRFRTYTALQVDIKSAILIALFLLVTVSSVALLPVMDTPANQDRTTLEDESATTNIAAGGIWALVEVIFAVFILIGAYLWKRTSERIQRILKKSFKVAFFVTLGTFGVSYGAAGAIIIGAFVLTAIGVTASEYDIYWIVNNIIAVLIAIVFAVAAGYLLPPWFIIAGLIGLSVYDHYFANKQEWMFTIAGTLISKKLPVIIFIPKTIRFAWERLLEGFDDEDETEEILTLGIGTADVILPIMLIVSVTSRTEAVLGLFSIEAIGITLGVLIACLHLSYVMDNRGSGAGLPPLTTGALGGWAIALIYLWLVAPSPAPFPV